jgi:hypothetical protein
MAASKLLLLHHNLQYEFHVDARESLQLELGSLTADAAPVLSTTVTSNAQWTRLPVTHPGAGSLRSVYAVLQAWQRTAVKFLPSSPDKGEGRDMLLRLLYDSYYVSRGCWYPATDQFPSKPKVQRGHTRRVFEMERFMASHEIRQAAVFEAVDGENAAPDLGLRSRPATRLLRVCFDLCLLENSSFGYFEWTSKLAGSWRNHVPLLDLWTHLERKRGPGSAAASSHITSSSSSFSSSNISFSSQHHVPFACAIHPDAAAKAGVRVHEPGALQAAKAAILAAESASKQAIGSTSVVSALRAAVGQTLEATARQLRRPAAMTFYLQRMRELEAPDEAPAVGSGAGKGKSPALWHRVGKLADAGSSVFDLWYQPHSEELRLTVNAELLRPPKGGIVVNLPLSKKGQIVAKLVQGRPAISSCAHAAGSVDFPGTLLVCEASSRWFWFAALSKDAPPKMRVYTFEPDLWVHRPTPHTVVIITYHQLAKAMRKPARLSTGDPKATGAPLFLHWFARVIFDDAQRKRAAEHQSIAAKWLRATVRWAFVQALPKEFGAALMTGNNLQLSRLHLTRLFLRQQPRRLCDLLARWTVFWPQEQAEAEADAKTGGGKKRKSTKKTKATKATKATKVTKAAKAAKPGRKRRRPTPQRPLQSAGLARVVRVPLTPLGRAAYEEEVATLQDLLQHIPAANELQRLRTARACLRRLVGEHGTEPLAIERLAEEVPAKQDCPICYETLAPFRCVKLVACGHLLCSACTRTCVKRKLDGCSLCRAKNRFPDMYRLLTGLPKSAPSNSSSGSKTVSNENESTAAQEQLRTGKFGWLQAQVQRRSSGLIAVAFDDAATGDAVKGWAAVAKIPAVSLDASSWQSVKRVLDFGLRHTAAPTRRSTRGKRAKTRPPAADSADAADLTEADSACAAASAETDSACAAASATVSGAGLIFVSQRLLQTSLLFPFPLELVVLLEPCWTTRKDPYVCWWSGVGGNCVPTVILSTSGTAEEEAALSSSAGRTALKALLPALPIVPPAAVPPVVPPAAPPVVPPIVAV